MNWSTAASGNGPRRAQVEDHLVDNENQHATVVAEEVLHPVGWLPSRAGGQ
jgi:hypothetical protein